MSIESATEQGLKTAFKAYTDTLPPESAVAYRCFFLDDESESGKTTEDREYPFISITASPNVPQAHKSPFREVPVAFKWATHRQQDPKQAALASLYENTRTILDNETGILVTGYTFSAVIIEAGGESDDEENEQYITLPVIVKICGA